MNYKRHYEALVARALARTLPRGTYIEKHHIIPKCVGGEDVKSNLVKLLPEEHLFAHRLLCRIYPVPSLAYAVVLMSKGCKGALSRKIYAMDRARVSKANSHIPRKPISDEHRRRISEAQRSRIRVGFACSDEHKAKISAAMKLARAKF